MEKNAKIYVAGHTGLVGSAIIRKLEKTYSNIIVRTSGELNLIRQDETERFFEKEKPDYVFLAAAKVGGIHANNTFPAEFIYNNLMIAANVIHAAYMYGAKKLLFLGSSCIYPRIAPQPLKEEYLLTGALEPTNEAYAIAKISGIELVKFYRKQYGCDFISVSPTNLYGINDNFDLETSNVLPALIRKFYEARINSYNEVAVWGTGESRREFLFVDDLADACVYLMDNYSGDSHVNIGTGEDLKISELANIIKKIAGYEGSIVYDTSKPDGMPRRVVDVTLLRSIGWKHSVSLEDGIRKVYKWYEELHNQERWI